MNKIYYLVICAVILAYSCDKDEIPAASYDSGIWFYGDANDLPLNSSYDTDVRVRQMFTRSVSFYYVDEEYEYVFTLPEVRIMGDIVDYDRQIEFEVVADSSSAVEGVHYKIVDNVMPAHERSVFPRITLYRDPSLKDTTVTLQLRLKSNADFPAGFGQDTVSMDRTFVMSHNAYLQISDIAIEPPYWNSLPQKFGTWSRVRADFIKETLGFYLGLEPVTTDDLNDLYILLTKLRQAQRLYESLHGNLIDENGNTISFY